AAARLDAKLDADAIAAALDASAARGSDGGIEIAFAIDPKVHDGRFANNPWLQELPAPITKLTWDNAALVAPATAARLGLASEDVALLALGTRELRAPILVCVGHAEDAVTLHLGYGRDDGAVARGVGVDACILRKAASKWFERGLRVMRTGDRHPL